MSRDHLLAIDADQWPGVTQPPSVRLRARIAEAYFARTADKAGLDLLDDPDLVIDHEELFDRVAVSGWLGLAESYMAGEWRTRDSDALVEVVQALISAGYRPRVRQVPVGRKEGELPPELIRQFSGDGMSAFGAVYSSGVPTTVRESVPSYVPGAGRGSEPAKHFVDVTTVAEPTSVERADLGDGQRRAVEKLLDAAQVTRGTHVLEYPSSGGEVAIAAAQRRAAVDVLTRDPELASALEERMLLAGVDDAVQTELVDDPRAWRGRYDAIIGVENLETLGGRQRDAYVRGLDRLLAIGGRAALQTVVATEEMTAAGLDDQVWQCPVVLLADVRSVGVQGDFRTYGHPIVLRPVTSEDAMTADWARIPYEVLEKISTRITNEVEGVNRVVLDVTSKPPGTIEWE